MPATCDHATIYRQNTLLDGIYSFLWGQVVLQCDDCRTVFLVEVSLLVHVPFPLSPLSEGDRERVLNELGRDGQDGR